MNEITLLDFDYADATYAPLCGKQIQVLAIHDLPEFIPFVCEEEWHKDDDHVRRGAIYVRSGTNTREGNYDQVQRLLNRRIEAIAPQSSTNHVKRDLDQLRLLEMAAQDTDSADGAYLGDLIERKRLMLERALGLTPDGE